MKPFDGAVSQGRGGFGIVAAVVSLAMALAGSLTGQASSRPPSVDHRLGRGVNILGSDGMFDPPYGTDFSFTTFAKLADFGFQHVRINAHPFSHITDTGALDDRWIATMRKVIDAALASGLQVVVDVHETERCQRAARDCAEKLEQTWRSLSLDLRDYDDRVSFEILNEPGGEIAPDLWNRMIADNLSLIRISNPSRQVIIGPANGNDFRQLDALKIPASDAHILIDIHYYEPFVFTHQGTPWTPLKNKVGVVWGSPHDIDALDHDLARIAEWADAHRQTIYLGEFGVYDRADPRSRSCYLSRITRGAARLKWPWAYWQLTPDFRILNEKTGEWNTSILTALAGDGAAPRCDLQASGGSPGR